MGFQPTCGHDVDVATQQGLQVVLQVCEVEQRTAGLEVNEKVDVALRAVIASGDRTEDGDRPAVMATHECRDLVAERFNLLETCAHDTQVTESARSDQTALLADQPDDPIHSPKWRAQVPCVARCLASP